MAVSPNGEKHQAKGLSQTDIKKNRKKGQQTQHSASRKSPAPSPSSGAPSSSPFRHHHHHREYAVGASPFIRSSPSTSPSSSPSAAQPSLSSNQSSPSARGRGGGGGGRGDSGRGWLARRERSPAGASSSERGGAAALAEWSNAVRWDRVKQAVDVHLNELGLTDRDLEHFIVWFEGPDSGRFSLRWLLAQRDNTQQHEGRLADKDDAEAKKQKRKKKRKLPGMNWHLQENQITDEGVKLLMAFVRRIQSHMEMRRFYLYKNIIGAFFILPLRSFFNGISVWDHLILIAGDEAANVIALFIRESPTSVREIHLSHNRLTIKGACPFPPLSFPRVSLLHQIMKSVNQGLRRYSWPPRRQQLARLGRYGSGFFFRPRLVH